MNKKKQEPKKRYIAIGNFDGLHEGHQMLLSRACALSKERAKEQPEEQELSATLLSFAPHPRLFFNPDQAPLSLTSPSQKKRLLASIGLDEWAVCPFDSALAALSPEDFVDQILVEQLACGGVIIGEDFRFGQKRAGDAVFLKKQGEKKGFSVEIAPLKMNRNNYVISSTMIREAIRQGDIDKANRLLNWPQGLRWEIEGEIIHGDKRGRELGYPTANMKLGDYVRPLYGVYAVKIALDDGSLSPQWLKGVANLGVRPMFETPQPLLETFIFDFDREIYGSIARVQPIARLRGEARFDSLEALKEQMKKDCTQARALLDSA